MKKKNVQRENLEKSIQWHIDKYIKRMELSKQLPIEVFLEHFPQGTWEDCLYDFEFRLPLDFKLEAEVISFIEYQGYKHSEVTRHIWGESNAAGDFIQVWFGERWSDGFQVAFRSSEDGTTCVLKPVGTKEVPVYEVVCSEGAQEEW